MTPSQITQAAEILAKAQLEHKRIERLSGELRPQDRKTAVAIQDELARLIGHKVVGWKVGGELVGRVFQPNLLKSPAELPEKIYGNAMVEAELGFRMLSDLPARSAVYNADEVAEHAMLVSAFELGGTHFSGEKIDPQIETDFLLAYAANSLQLGVVVGDEIKDWREMSLLDMKIELTIDGGSPVPGLPDELRREPLDVLVLLANDLSQRGIGLEADQVVVLGAAAMAPMGKKAIATFGELSRIEARITSP